MHARAGEVIKAEGGSASFEPLDLIGEGRTGEVYLVRDTRDGDEQLPLQLRVAAVTRQMPETYALKLAREEGGGSLAERNERVCLEQAALEHLVHPGIVRSGTGGWHQGRAFFSMELLEGPSLGRFLSERRRSYRATMKLFLGVTDAVARCHERGILHRDLRPSNFTVEPDRGPVLFDFESCETRPRSECSRVGVGAAEYAHPDYLAYVLDPSVSYVNQPRADVYAMAVMLYSALTGRLPVERGAESLEEYLRALRDVKPVSPTLLNAEVPLACAALAMRLLSRHGPVTALELPRLVREAMEDDEPELDRLAPRYRADTETLLSSVVIRARRPVSARWTDRWDAVRRVARRHASHAAGVAFVVAVTWLSASVTLQVQTWLARDARLAESSRVLVEKRAVMVRAAEQLKAQLAAAQSRPESLLQKLVLGGSKTPMPERPEPNWLKPSADGKCHDPVSGQALQGAVAVRGACWSPSVKIKPEYHCPEGTFEAPPEVATTPRLRHLRNNCFQPLTLDPQAAK